MIQVTSGKLTIELLARRQNAVFSSAPTASISKPMVQGLRSPQTINVRATARARPSYRDRGFSRAAPGAKRRGVVIDNSSLPTRRAHRQAAPVRQGLYCFAPCPLVGLAGQGLWSFCRALATESGSGTPPSRGFLAGVFDASHPFCTDCRDAGVGEAAGRCACGTAVCAEGRTGGACVTGTIATPGFISSFSA